MYIVLTISHPDPEKALPGTPEVNKNLPERRAAVFERARIHMRWLGRHFSVTKEQQFSIQDGVSGRAKSIDNGQPGPPSRLVQLCHLYL